MIHVRNWQTILMILLYFQVIAFAEKYCEHDRDIEPCHHCLSGMYKLSEFGEDRTFELAINQAMMDKDANQLLVTVAAFMKHHGLQVDSEYVAGIPLKSQG